MTDYVTREAFEVGCKCAEDGVHRCDLSWLVDDDVCDMWVSSKGFMVWSGSHMRGWFGLAGRCE